jgi:hypothetical protein
MRPRIRSVKPEIHTDEELWDLELETGLPLFRAFVGLWNYADREGRFEWRPRPLKAAILPYWEGDFEAALDALVAGRFVVKYTVGGKAYGWVRTFTEHQVVNTREPPSSLPAPPDMCTHVRARAETEHARGEWEREGNGKGTEGKESSPAPETRVGADPSPEVREPVGRLSRFAPADFQPTPEHRTRCQELRFDVDGLVKAFKRHEFKRTYSDWNRRFADWIEKEKIIRETAQASPANAPRASPGSDIDTTSAATAFCPTDEHRAYARDKRLELDHAVRLYRASPKARELGTVPQERDFLNRLKCWHATGTFHPDGPLPKRSRATEAA